MQTIDINNVGATIQSIKSYSKELGYEMDDGDCLDLIVTGFHGESIQSAVEDWLNAWETCRQFGREDDE